MAKVIVKKGQSLLDIALQTTGSAEGVFELIAKNKLNGMTDNVPAGEEVEVADTPLQFRVQRFLQSYDIATVSPEEQSSGIGWMRIGDTFIIS